jgi:hypothetical protein
MISSPLGEPVGPTQADTTTSSPHPALSDSNRVLSRLNAETPQQEYQLQMSTLQYCICELLIKNQQLRLALMEMKAKGQGDDNGRNP